jgi:hypothetical protein
MNELQGGGGGGARPLARPGSRRRLGTFLHIKDADMSNPAPPVDNARGDEVSRKIDVDLWDDNAKARRSSGVSCQAGGSDDRFTRRAAEIHAGRWTVRPIRPSGPVFSGTDLLDTSSSVKWQRVPGLGCAAMSPDRLPVRTDAQGRPKNVGPRGYRLRQARQDELTNQAPRTIVAERHAMVPRSRRKRK